MGLVLDSTVIVAAERARRNPRKIADELTAASGDADAAVSVVTVLELAHGIERADTERRREMRQEFYRELIEQVPIHPVSVSIAFRAGRIDGFLRAKGLGIALADLLIGATALELGYAVATHNRRHFDRIPDLEVRVL